MMKRLLLFVVVLAVSFAGMAQQDWSEVNSNLSTGLGVGEVSASMNNADALWALAINDDGSLGDEFTMSTDGGQSWTAGDFNPVSSPSPSMIFGVDENEAWTVMNSSPKGIYKTTDGGDNWTEVGDYYGASSSFANVVHFFNDTDGFCQGDPVGGYYELYTTSDGGDTWNRVPEQDIPAPLSGEYGITGNYDAVGDNIWFGTNMGRVFYSTDKGQTWDVTTTQFGTSETVDCLFLSADYGIAYRSYLDMGIEPTINVTNDGGETWEEVNVNGDMYARYFTHVPGTEMTIVSSSSEPGSEGMSYSTDGGYSWSTLEAGYPYQAHYWWDNETAVCGTWVTAGSGGMLIYEGDPLMTLDPPQNLSAEVDGMDVHLDWDAPGGGGETEELIYDNGTSTGSYSYEGYTMATHMSPSGACQVLTLKYYTTIESGDNTFNTNVYEWEGSQPGTDLIYTGTETAIDGDWMEVDISGENVTFDGDFVVGFGSINATTYLGYDANLNNGRSWDFDNASSWSQWNEAYLIRAIVQYTDGTLAEVGPNGYEKVLNSNPENRTARTHSLSTNNQEPIQNTLGGRALIGYNVYRDGDLLTDTPIEATDYDDLELDPGVYSYTVTAVYDEGESSPAGPVEVVIENPNLDPPNNVQYEVDGNTVMLTWETPGVNPQWIHWDDGTNGNSIGLTSGGSFELAAKWDPSHIMDFDGFSITKVKIFPAGFTCDYKLKIQKGPNAGTLVYEQDLSGLEIEAWNEITLDSPVALDVTKELWVGYEVIEHDAGDYPGGTDSGPAEAGYGDMLNTGSSWVSMSTQYGLDYNWNVQVYVEQADVEPVALNKPANTEFNNESEDLTVVEAATSQSTYSPMAELQGYNVYRDDSQLNSQLIEDLFYDDTDVPPGTYTYGVTAVYDEGESPAEEVEVTVQEPLLLPPSNLEANTSNGDVELTWTAPGEPDEWIHYDDGTNFNSIGGTSGGTMEVAIRFDTDQLQDYDGMKLTKIRFFPNGFTADYQLKVWTGENAANLVHEQMVDGPEIEAWNEIMLDQMITIDASEELWFGYAAIDYDAGDYPAGCDQGPAVAGYGDMIKLGSSWVSMSNEYGLDYNWNIQGGVADMSGFPIQAQPTLEDNVEVDRNTEFAVQSKPAVSLQDGIYSPMMALQGYNVYRDDAMINESLVTETMYTDQDLPTGTYEYYVTAVYDAGESEGSNTVEVTITGIDDVEAGKLSIYPVPANDFVNVESDVTVKSVRVMNHVGQLVYSNDATDKQFRINVSDFDAGVYFIQLETETGVVTKKISIQ
ncbi:MAG: T9SS type A sorting domain-containing protein [Bacteroidales bacterium]|nr:T9SS type A sorting domain-containing protein [Bacteroidales bacterium]